MLTPRPGAGFKEVTEDIHELSRPLGSDDYILVIAGTNSIENTEEKILPAYHNLRQRVEGSVAAFLRMNPWRPDMNKNQLRDNLRKHIQSGGFLDIGVDRIVDQVVNPKIYTVFLPKVEEVVQSCLEMENDQPKFEPPPLTEVKSEPPKFQDKHNLAPRAKLPAPLMGPILKPLKPADQAVGRPSSPAEKMMDNGGDTDTEEASDKKYVVDEDELEGKEEDEDDEESPPFEPHSEGDRLILGMRSDSSDNSNDSQVVTTIVDDSLEERIDNNEISVKEESDKKDEDSSSDEYVPKTPTINMEESDGPVHEFNSVNEYKQYQTKFEEESFGNVEEVVSSQCINDNQESVKEERSSNEEDYGSTPRKIKLNADSYDDASSSSIDKESTSDEIKPAVFELFKKKQFKLEEYDLENETSELSMNEAENEDSYTEKSLDLTDSKNKSFENEHDEKQKGSSTSSKDSGKSYHPHHSHHKDHKESSNSHSSKDKTNDKHHENTRSSHSSSERKDGHKKHDKHESSKDQHKERDRKRSSESSSKHNDKDARSKHYDKEKEKDKKRSNSSERSKKENEDTYKSKKETRHEPKDDHQERKSKDYHDKEKKKHSSRDRHSDHGKKDHESAHKSDKVRREDSKHSHSSSKHSHRSSSEKHKSDKDYKNKGSSDRHKSHDKKSDKDNKEESRKKYRQHCKYTSDKDENRRSSDRDSSGPSNRTHMPSSSKSTTSRTHKESKVETGEKTTSNSDNTVSDNIEALQNDAKFDLINEPGIASPDFLIVEDSWNESDSMVSDWNSSKEEKGYQSFETENSRNDANNEMQGEKIKFSEHFESIKTIIDTSSAHFPAILSVQVDPETDDFMDSFQKSTSDINSNNENEEDFSVPSISVHDSSSEKENIEQITKEQTNNEFEDNNANSSLDEDSTVIKFKKPKIAKNIHEVKKIMEARRHLKRMEKKRMKLLMKNNPEEYESDEKSPSENKLEEKFQEHNFRGFEDFSLEKIKKYDCLTERLKREASELEQLINYDTINSNLITSWVDFNPEFDSYIENTLKGKVHRKYRVCLPPICDEYYRYDPEQNIYFLTKNLDVTEQKESLVDRNLNNLNSVDPIDQQENQMSYSEVNIKKRKLNEGTLPCSNSETILHGNGYSKQNSPKQKIGPKKIKPDNEAVEIIEENIVSSSVTAFRATKDISNAVGNSSDVIASPKFSVSLTFNQTYDEVLKEKAQNSVVPSKKQVEEICKTSRTVVKITNNKTSEQVFMKKIQPNSEDKGIVPRITRSETTMNGKLSEKPPELKKIPLISRIIKTKNVSSPPTIKAKSQCGNGFMSPDSTTNFEEELPKGVSQKIINDVIGIQNETSDQGSTSDQDSQSEEDSSDQRPRRMPGCRQQQRYDSTDLYKPRLQLSSRRVRAVDSSPEEKSPAPQMVSRRKRSATADLNTTTHKRRR